jgi:hypothetical protein
MYLTLDWTVKAAAMRVLPAPYPARDVWSPAGAAPAQQLGLPASAGGALSHVQQPAAAESAGTDLTAAEPSALWRWQAGYRQRHHEMWLRRLGLAAEVAELRKLQAALRASRAERNNARSSLALAEQMLVSERAARGFAASAEATSRAAQRDDEAGRHKARAQAALRRIAEAESAADTASRTFEMASLAAASRAVALARLERHVTMLEGDAAVLRRNVLQLRQLKLARDAEAARAARDYAAASVHSAGFKAATRELAALVGRYGTPPLQGAPALPQPTPGSRVGGDAVAVYSRSYDQWRASDAPDMGNSHSGNGSAPTASTDAERLAWLRRLGMGAEVLQLQQRRDAVRTETERATRSAAEVLKLQSALLADAAAAARADAALAAAVARGAPAQVAQDAQTAARVARDAAAKHTAEWAIAEATQADAHANAASRSAALREYEAVLVAQEAHMARAALAVLDGAIARIEPDSRSAYAAHDFEASELLSKQLAARRAVRARLVDAYALLPADAPAEATAELRVALKEAAKVSREEQQGALFQAPDGGADEAAEQRGLFAHLRAEVRRVVNAVVAFLQEAIMTVFIVAAVIGLGSMQEQREQAAATPRRGLSLSSSFGRRSLGHEALAREQRRLQERQLKLARDELALQRRAHELVMLETRHNTEREAMRRDLAAARGKAKVALQETLTRLVAKQDAAADELRHRHAREVQQEAPSLWQALINAFGAA